MPSHDLALADLAQRSAARRLSTYAAAPGIECRRGDGWFAVRTGAASNDLNGVVSAAHAPISAELVADLVGWFAATPASWLTERPDPGLTSLLLAAGARAERTGHWSGRLLPGPLPDLNGVEIVRVRSHRQLRQWLAVATDCGWIETASDREARRRLFLAVGLDHPDYSHWLAVDGHQPVGFASAYVHEQVVDLCNLGVRADRRRQGIGRALVAARLTLAAHRGAAAVVSAPSPDGWELQRALGFWTVPVLPDTCFYLPVADTARDGPATREAG